MTPDEAVRMSDDRCTDWTGFSRDDPCVVCGRPASTHEGMRSEVGHFWSWTDLMRLVPELEARIAADADYITELIAERDEARRLAVAARNGAIHASTRFVWEDDDE